MLPSAGYFKGINCPFYESGLCERPYCHFRHTKKETDTNNETFENGEILEQLVSKAVKKVLEHADSNSSDKESILHSEQLISKVVQELTPVATIKSAITPTKVTYNPTPISELNKLAPAKNEFIPAPSRKEYLNRKHIPIPYTPHRPRTHGLRAARPESSSKLTMRAQDLGLGSTEKYTPVAAMECESTVKYLPGSVDHKPPPYSPMSTTSDNLMGMKSTSYTPTDISLIGEVSHQVAHYTPTGASISGVSYSPGAILPPAYSTSGYCPTNTGYSAISGSKSPCYTPTVTYRPTPLSKTTNPKFSSDEDDEPASKKSRMESSTSKSGLEDLDLEFEMLGEILDDENDKSSVIDSTISKSETVKNSHTLSYSKTDVSKVTSIHSKSKNTLSSSKEISEKKSENSKGEHKTSKSEHKPKSGSDTSEHKLDKLDHKSSKSGHRSERKSEHKSSKSDQKSHKSDHKSDKNEHRSDKSEHKSHKSDKKLDKTTHKSNKHSSSDHKSSKSSNHESDKSSVKESERTKSQKSNSSDKHHSSRKKDDGLSVKGKEKELHSEKSKSHKSSSSSVSKSKSKDSRGSDSEKIKKSLNSTSSKSKEYNSQSSSSNKKSDKNYKSKCNSKTDTSKSSSKRSSEKKSKEREKHKSSKNSSRSKDCSEMDIDSSIEDYVSDAELIEELSDSDEERITEECLKIFEEYVPTIKEKTTSENINKHDVSKMDDCISKKRVAHNTSQTIYRTPNQIIPDHKGKAIQLAADRYAKVKQFHESRTKRVSTETYQPQFHHIQEEPLASSSSSSKVRIAHVPNVSTLLCAKKALQVEIPPAPKSTTVQTVTKGTSRLAHMPNDKFCERPGVLEPLGSKIPVNIRSRYLNLMIDECLKIYLTVEDTYARAQQEELSTSKKCTAIPIYKNSALLTISRLRKEVLEAGGVKINKSDAGQSGISHNKVLLGKLADKTSWSIESKSKKDDFSAEFKDVKFYENIFRWVLTEDELRNNGFPRPHPDKKDKGLAKIYTVNTRQKPQKGFIRTCCRCKKEYTVDKKGMAVRTEECIYHPNNKYRFRGEVKYQCCSQDATSDGCLSASCHVYEYVDHDNLRGYVRTLPKDKKNGDYGVFALDCEMCYTSNGLDLTRVTVIDKTLNVVYESLVKPFYPIIDYNTRYSGLTEEDMKDVSTTLLEVQATFLHLFSDKTILVGHSLESDFKALKLIHDTVVDTSVLFPHKMGPPYKRALRNLSSECLRKIIQNSVDGHDSAEDATVCMELLLWKLKEELKTR